jgi:polar amino acid transport system substrate-binding protein
VTLRWRIGLAAVVLLLAGSGATARSLAAITERGAITLCAHPNALPFASRHGDVPGFQVEIATALAQRLGVALTQHWVINSFQYRRADCDVVLDAIADHAALAEVGLSMSRPYHCRGVVLAVPADSGVAGLADLRSRKVGVQVGSLASMTLSRREIRTTPFAFEDEILDALARHEIEAAAVTPAAIGWFNVTHPNDRIRAVPAFADDPDLNWNVVAGMLGPDDKLTQAVDAALDGMLADGTLARIYARYGSELCRPR